ncbi:MAG TPA: hypothetical protein PK095_13985 [Myxococcota bacterium]|nr:hypothetical protein [Myxococcota bacterium]
MSAHITRPPASEPPRSAPISYTLDPERGVIYETWRGSVSARDLERYWMRYLADPEVLALRRTLVDLRDATILFRGEDLVDSSRPTSCRY